MPAAPFKVKAVFDYKSEETDDLSFDNGQIITVTEDEDADWYTGEYTTAAGDKVEGIFPRNFVEKYEPAIPSRPARTPKRPTAPEPTTAELPPVHHEPPASQLHAPVKGVETETPQLAQSSASAEEPIAQKAGPAAASASATEETKTTAPPPAAARPPKPAPPVAEKPSSNSFKDRIAAFNKSTAAPIAPFKPGSQASSAFIKKPFVAPPPSKNSYVPPPREAPPQKIYRREEDPSLQPEQERDAPPPPQVPAQEDGEDQPKPTSLKERIALLQKQQLEQAQRQAESGQKKDKPKKPSRKQTEASEDAPVTADPPIERFDTNETVRKTALEPADEDSEDAGPPRYSSGPAAATPPPPARELVSDTNDADDSGAADTEDAQETSTEEDRPRSKGVITVAHVEPVAPKTELDTPSEDAAQQEDEEEEEEEEEEDPEIRRRRELRERMAKMSGGMGMMGMFGGGMANAPPPRRTKPSSEVDRHGGEEQQETSRAPPIPIMALPGMSTQIPKRKEEPPEAESDHDEAAAPTPQDPINEPEATEDHISQPPKRSSTGRSVSSTGQERAMPPPPPPRESRAPPPPPPGMRAVPEAPQSPTARPVPPPPPLTARAPEELADSDDDDEEEVPPPAASLPPRQQATDALPTSPTTAPPVPKTRPEALQQPPTSPLSSSQSRPPPPPPPGQPPSRRSTSDSLAKHRAGEDSDAEVTEYDGDYDTDIASSAKHKDALKSHNRDSSIDDGILTDDAAKSPISPLTRAMPPLPVTSAPRDVPPPPPPSSAPKSRKSLDVPRAAPPPVPPPQAADEEDYDPYRYAAPHHGMPSPSIRAPYAPALSSPREELDEEDMYGATIQPPRMPRPPPGDRSAPPPPMAAPMPEAPKPSFDAKRSATTSRRSMEQSRPSGEHGSIASDIDLGQSSFWWTQENLPPPALQNRSDVLYEMESSTSSKRGGKATVSKDVYVLYMDYSQSTINATFDASDPSHITLEQSHQRPPPPPRKDQLETASESLGAQIAASASTFGTSGSTVADGSAQSFVTELLRPLPGVLRPVGCRAYGALVYANLANASTQQYDEIRPGDIVTFRNAKFSGHKGGLHQKYSMEAGKPDHVGVVLDWDGTKKKIRAWEQGREEKGKKAKVREESYKVGDLKSGEVRVWRVMPRSWVGWDK